jgi:hypothetical protein
VGVEQQTAATSSMSVRSVWWPTEEMTGHGQERHRAAQRLVAEREQVREGPAPAGHHDDVHAAHGREVLQRARDPRGGVAVLDGGERPHQAPLPAPPAQPGEHVVAGLAALAGHHADRPRQLGARQALLGQQQALGVQHAPQAVHLGQEVALARDPQVGDREVEVRGGLRGARVVVRAARHDDLGAVGQGARGQAERLEVGAPHRAVQGAARVAQLPVHLRARQAQA